ncbi:MAG: hypothetical protein QNJ64_16325 [Crocosphaera sp.]|nr:hypothetical protein [Crocosphaera sp.]
MLDHSNRNMVKIMSFILLTQLEEILLNFIVTSPSSYTELDQLTTDLYLDYRQISRGRLSTTLSKMVKKGIITKDKDVHIDSNGNHCYYTYNSTQSGIELLNIYNSLHQMLDYSLTQYSKIKNKRIPKYVRR